MVDNAVFQFYLQVTVIDMLDTYVIGNNILREDVDECLCKSCSQIHNEPLVIIDKYPLYVTGNVRVWLLEIKTHLHPLDARQKRKFAPRCYG